MMNKKIVIVFVLTAVLLSVIGGLCLAATTPGSAPRPGYESLPPIGKLLGVFSQATGLYAFFCPSTGTWVDGIGRIAMVATGLFLVFLAMFH